MKKKKETEIDRSNQFKERQSSVITGSKLTLAMISILGMISRCKTPIQKLNDINQCFLTQENLQDASDQCKETVFSRFKSSQIS